MEGLRRNAALASALTAVTAAVVGVILNLALWFAMHVLFSATTKLAAGPIRMELPVPASLDLAAALLSAVALFAAFRLNLGMAKLLGGAAFAGICLHLAGLV